MVQPFSSPMFRDRLAARFFTLGGVSVLLSLVVLVGFLLWELAPLFQSPALTYLGQVQTESDADPPLLVGADPGLGQVFTLDRHGLLRFTAFLGERSEPTVIDLAAQTPAGAAGQNVALVHAARGEGDLLYLLWQDGTIQVYRLGFEFTQRRPAPPRYAFVSQCVLQVAAEGGFRAGDRLAVAYTAKQKLTVARLDVEGGIELQHWWLAATSPRSPYIDGLEVEGEQEVVESQCYLLRDHHRAVVDFALDGQGRYLYAAEPGGWLSVWDVADGRSALCARTQVSEGRIEQMALLAGDVSCVIVDQMGRVSIWNYLTAGAEAGRLVAIQTLSGPRRPGLVPFAIPSGKAFLTYAPFDGLRLFNLIGADSLLHTAEVPELAQLQIGQGGVSVLGLARDNTLHVWRLEQLEKAFQWRSLFAKVWYEGYPEPGWVWQSSSAAGSFQPKLSLVPLIWGSLKGAVYGMLFSFPLAVLCAVYVSFLMHPKWRLWVKPAVELMSAIPTVVIGFFVAMWFAPIVRDDLLGLVGVMIMFPVLIGAALLVLLRSKRGVTGREFLWGMPVFFIALWGAFQLGSFLEAHFFMPSFSLWLFERFELRLEQRNSLVVAFGLGLAVIPLVFTVAEDALSSVPKSLVAAATALGGSRWQTLRYIVLPRAFPGMIVAGLIGFGRVLGETMIVLIASGNTPIISAGPLSGMRSLAANMVVEISEASVDSHLYRVLILSAVMLLLVTFFVNTLAALLRLRMKRGHYEF